MSIAAVTRDARVSLVNWLREFELKSTKTKVQITLLFNIFSKLNLVAYKLFSIYKIVYLSPKGSFLIYFAAAASFIKEKSQDP